MQETLAPTPSEIVELLKAAMDKGHTIILPAPAARVTSPDTGSSSALTSRLRLGLTRAESRVLVWLLENEHVDKEQLHAAMAQDGDPATNIKIVGVLVHKLRKKLKPHGIEVATVWGTGYGLTADARDKLRKILAGYNAVDSKPDTPP